MNKTVRIDTQKPYDVVIGRGVRGSIGSMLTELLDTRRIVVVTDVNVRETACFRDVESSLKAAYGDGVSICAIGAGEKYKTPETYLRIVSALANNMLSRRDAVVAVGGGVVGDVAGFAAATYMRGIDFVQMPTSLLAMIDSSVGGKTGVDMPFGKNMLGAFHQPRLAAIDPDFLCTLSLEEMLNGMGEGAKYVCLMGGKMRELFMGAKDDLEAFVEACVTYKAGIVASDEMDMGARRLLNFGHTMGHAIELDSGYGIHHGKAMAMGIELMAQAALNAGELSKDGYCEVEEILSKVGVSKETTERLDLRRLLMIVRRDKKADSDGLWFVKIEGLGKCAALRATYDEFERYILGK